MEPVKLWTNEIGNHGTRSRGYHTGTTKAENHGSEDNCGPRHYEAKEPKGQWGPNTLAPGTTARLTQGWDGDELSIYARARGR